MGCIGAVWICTSEMSLLAGLQCLSLEYLKHLHTVSSTFRVFSSQDNKEDVQWLCAFLRN